VSKIDEVVILYKYDVYVICFHTCFVDDMSIKGEINYIRSRKIYD